MRNAGLEEAQAGIKIARRNINNLRYADDMVLYIENPKDSTQKLLDPINEFNKICWIIKKAREFQKNIYFCFIDYTKAFDCVDHNKLENS